MLEIFSNLYEKWRRLPMMLKEKIGWRGKFPSCAASHHSRHSSAVIEQLRIQREECEIRQKKGKRKLSYWLSSRNRKLLRSSILKGVQVGLAQTTESFKVT